MATGFQLGGQGPLAYEEHLVPVLFAPCAELLLDLAEVKPGERVLDVACGTGIVARRARGRVGTGGTVVGVDANRPMIQLARALARRVEWHEADAAMLPLPDGGFDAVCCQQGLQFFADRPAALAEMRRMCRPGGRVVLAVWRGLEHHPAFAAFVKVLGDRLGAEVAAMMAAPFAGPGYGELHGLMAGAGFTDVHVGVGMLPARFPSPLEFVRQEVAGTPLAEPVGALGEAELTALTDQVEQALQPYLDDDGVIFPMQTWLISCVF